MSTAALYAFRQVAVNNAVQTPQANAVSRSRHFYTASQSTSVVGVAAAEAKAGLPR